MSVTIYKSTPSWGAVIAWCIVPFIVIASTAYNKFVPSDGLELTAKVRECFRQERIHCSDKICEMSTDDPYEILEQVESNVMECVGK